MSRSTRGRVRLPRHQETAPGSASPSGCGLQPAPRARPRRGCRAGARAGFTLIELLAVLVILSILMVVLLPRLSGFGDSARAKATKAFLRTIDAALSEYENRFGDYPPSQFLEQWGAPPNATNLGAETLFLSLWSPAWGGAPLPDDKLVNTDGDETRTTLTTLPAPKLFELADEWGNPVAYFHRRDYGRQDVYLLENPATGELEDCTVTAKRNARTQAWHNPSTYQLISAGIDGLFGTEDDIANFEFQGEAPR